MKSYYYKYDFISPEKIYAKVKEQLKSYFQTGVVDDVLFGIYTEDALDLLGRSTYKINENVFQVEDYTTQLPEGFEAVRELWLVTPHERSYKLPGARYEQTTCKISADRDRCDNKCGPCLPDEIKVTYKTTGTAIQTFDCHYLLRPGNISAMDKCAPDSLNPHVPFDNEDIFDIRDGKIITNFPEGTLYMVYYSKERDHSEYQLIPNNIRIKNYIELFLMYKSFETIRNNVSDETSNQIENKYQGYKQEYLEALSNAKVELKLQTIDQVIRSIRHQKSRLQKFQIT